MKLPWCAESFVYGNSLKNYVVGVFVVDPAAFPIYAKKMGLGEITIEDFCKNEMVRGALWKSLYECCKSEGCHGFEIPG